MGEEEKTYPSPSFLATSQYTQTLHTPLRRTGPPRQGPRQASGLDLGREQRKQRLWFGKQELEPAFLFQDYCWRAAGINKGGGHGGGGGRFGGRSTSCSTSHTCLCDSSRSRRCRWESGCLVSASGARAVGRKGSEPGVGGAGTGRWARLRGESQGLSPSSQLLLQLCAEFGGL